MKTKKDFLALIIKAQKADKDISGLMKLFKANLSEKEVNLIDTYLSALPEGDALALLHYQMG